MPRAWQAPPPGGSDVRKIDYFYTSIRDASGEGYRFLSRLAAHRVDLIAATAVPFGPDKAQFTVFPANSEDLTRAAQAENVVLDGPHTAILAEGPDEVGAFATVLAALAAARVDVFSAQGMTDGRGGFRYVVFLKASDIAGALSALGAPAGGT